MHPPTRADVQEGVRSGLIGFELPRKRWGEGRERPGVGVEVRDGGLDVAGDETARHPLGVEERAESRGAGHALHRRQGLGLHLVDDGVRARALRLGPTLDLGQDVLGLATHTTVHLGEVVIGHRQRAVHVHDHPAEGSGGGAHRRGGGGGARASGVSSSRGRATDGDGALTEPSERRQGRRAHRCDDATKPSPRSY